MDLTWTPVDLSVLQDLRSSNQTAALDRRHWPPWAQQAEQIQRMWLWCPGVPTVVPSTGTTSPVVGRLLSERLDSKDRDPFNYNFYFLVEANDERIWQSSPVRIVDFGHQLPAPPGFLDDYLPKRQE